MTEALYGVVKRRPDGRSHLVLGRETEALCGVRWRGGAWASVMRGIVGVDTARSMENICGDCVRAADEVAAQ